MVTNLSVPEASPARRPRWMLVDDDILNVALLGKLLRDGGGVETDCFQSGRAALAALASAPDAFDFIVTDLDMPSMDGRELCRQMHAISPRLRILLATTNGDLTSEDAARAGFCGLLRKPFPLAALLRAAEAPEMPAPLPTEPGRPTV